MATLKEQFQVHAGQNGYAEVAGTGAFTTTASSVEIDCKGMKKIIDFSFVPVGTTAAAKVPFTSGAAGTVSATQILTVRVPKTGVISAINFIVTTTVSTDDTNYWTVGVVNKGAAGSGSTVVADGADAANSNKVTGGSAFTAYVSRSVTLTATTADLAVTEGDILAITFTKAASAANLVNLTVDGAQTTSGTDESLYLDESRDIAGYVTVPSTGTITLARTGANKTSGLQFSYRVRGR